MGNDSGECRIPNFLKIIQKETYLPEFKIIVMKDDSYLLDGLYMDYKLLGQGLFQQECVIEVFYYQF